MSETQGTFVLAEDVERFGIAAVMLAQLRWLHGEARHVKWVKRDGHYWVAYADNEWIHSVGLGAQQARRARVKLEKAGVLETGIFKVDGTPTTHIRLVDLSISTGEDGDIDESLDSAISTSPPLSETDETNEGDIARSPSADFHDAFVLTWEQYPRKLNRKGAFKAWLARVKGGASLTDLHEATKNYAKIREGLDPVHTMHGATFFGPNDRWMDYLEPQPDAAAKPRPKQTPAQKRASRLLQLQRDREAANQRGLPA